MERVIGLGAGGHAKVLIDILRRGGLYTVIGLLDPARAGQELMGVPVRGGDDLLPSLRAGGIRYAFIGVGGVGDNTLRTALYHKVLEAGFEVVQAIHPAAIIAPSVRLGQGVAIMAGAIVNSDARLGENVIVNTGAIVEHDCEIGAHAHISPGAVLSGDVRVGAGAHVGAGATVRQNLAIGTQAVIGAGAAVIADIPDFAVAVGVPAKVKKYRSTVSAPAA